MEVKIDNIESLTIKQVPKHGKVSGIKSNSGAVRVIVPKESTKLSLTVTEPSEVLARSVTPDGKILGLTKFVGKQVFVIDQKENDFLKETGMVSGEIFKKDLKLFFDWSERYNLDPPDLLHKMIEIYIKDNPDAQKVYNDLLREKKDSRIGAKIND